MSFLHHLISVAKRPCKKRQKKWIEGQSKLAMLHNKIAIEHHQQLSSISSNSLEIELQIAVDHAQLITMNEAILPSFARLIANNQH